ncbi:sulfatase-like hydrolase/transferase [Sabulilitoribacter multivorans]|uniref:Sulfatase-like hydrolase/transferase n=1 Tax=Flaviramulus multivorans TaxID=1304750 RepID=A0ABS9IEH9_9FLAO|nr:sulfatase-like hydrolase/transferase [Flaviramulus multivorans]MCF7559197.1 sulfatase-like hydrolase/transferase [Flaviramulus multivorans]
MKKLLIITLFFCLFSCENKGQSVKKDKTPNIVLIVVDDQGYADFEPFENHDSSAETPNMGKLARSGMVFTQAYTTAPVCSPSRAGILTGKNQFRWDVKASWGPGLPDSVKTIPEYLKEMGYSTARIGKNDLGRNFHKYDVREYPLEHGYDEFLGFSAHAHDYWLLSKEIKDRTPDPSGTSAVLGPLMHDKGEKSYEEGYLTDILTDEAIQYIKKSKSKPFFLTLAYSSVHHLIHEVPQKYLDKYNVKSINNYDPDSLMAYGKHKPGSYAAYYDKYSRLGDIQDEDLRKYYLANLNCLDDNIGRLLESLKNENIDKETLIIFISDNGGSPLTGANNSPLTGGKYSLWEGGIRVPMALVWPGKIKPNQTQTDYVSATDILPTILYSAGIKLNDDTIDGVNLLQSKKDRLLVWKWQKTWAVRLGDWKLTNSNENHWKSRPSNLYIKPISNDLSLKLFNLKEDTGERIDLSSQYPDKVKELETAYQEWCKANIGNF